MEAVGRTDELVDKTVVATIASFSTYAVLYSGTTQVATPPPTPTATVTPPTATATATAEPPTATAMVQPPQTGDVSIGGLVQMVLGIGGLALAAGLLLLRRKRYA